MIPSEMALSAPGQGPKFHTPQPDLELIDRHELARPLSVSVSTVDRMIAGGKTVRPIALSRGCVRFRLTSVREWLATSERRGRLLTRVEWDALSHD